MPSSSDYEFSISQLTEDRWVITARSGAGKTTILTGVYRSRDAALGAIHRTSARWLEWIAGSQADTKDLIETSSKTWA